MSNELVLHDDSGIAFPHVITALIVKRAEIAGQIEHAQGEVKRPAIVLDHVEETLRLFAPDIGVQAITPRPVPITRSARSLTDHSGRLADGCRGAFDHSAY